MREYDRLDNRIVLYVGDHRGERAEFGATSGHLSHVIDIPSQVLEVMKGGDTPENRQKAIQKAFCRMKKRGHLHQQLAGGFWKLTQDGWMLWHRLHKKIARSV